ncbi:MAG: cytochrome c biogenesis protein ResB [Methylacidiphilales bacterium]|nr:cytochrome c biogenesis protein ResB [Candidatus Methylacidiphilales bacterium]MDW8349468.1 cytochrome C biogenesis protein ResB [Verrucomicrobiae bacterium]
MPEVSKPSHNQVWRTTIEILGSLKLAVFLLISIAIACAAATIAESRFNTAVARHYIYQAPWFIVWLLLLCVNLAAATLTRWPWQKKHTGFLITHLGIIVLLIGALIGRLTGFEGFVHLRIGEPPTGRVTLNQTMFQVESPADGLLYAIDFPVEVQRPTPKKPRRLAVPHTNLKLVIKDYAEHIESREVLEAVSSSSPVSAPGLALEFTSSMMRQSIPITLLQLEGKNEDSFFGHARIRWLLDDPLKNSPSDSEPSLSPSRETHVLFARRTQHPIIHSENNQPSGIQAYLLPVKSSLVSSTQPSDWKVILELSSEESYEYPLNDIIKKTLEVIPDVLQIKAHGFWHDFTMHQGSPTNRSDRPENPAVIIQLQINDVSALKTRILGLRELQFWPSSSPEAVSYRVLRSGKETLSGVLRKGESFAPGWADWQVKLNEYLPHAVIRKKNLPASIPLQSSGIESSAVPGLLVALTDSQGQRLDERWIASGEIASFFSANQVVRVGFGLKTRPLPFTVRLDRFEVPRDEGTDTPANFISHLTFRDTQTGLETSAKAQMNYPASFPGGLWRSALGLNYKFSQASWNPNDLDVTTLQVLYDPGWPFKWIGSLILCVGIGILFIGRKVNFNPSTQ